MTVKVIRGGARDWRPYRFPPRCSGALQEQWQGGDPVELQRAVADGYQHGSEKGYREGLEQGREAGQEEGLRAGRQEGLRQGREEGRAEGRQIFETAAQPLDRLRAEFQRFAENYEAQRREQLLELVQKVAKQVIRCELTLHPTQLLSLADEALAAMPERPQGVQLLLNPEECARIRELAPERAAAWRLVPDERLALGECRLLTAEEETDIGCQQRLDSCMQVLDEHLLGED